MRLLVDAAFVIDYLKDDPGAVSCWAEVFGRGDDPVISEIVVCDVRACLRDRDVAASAAFIEPVEFIQPGPEHALLVGQWRASARAMGRSLSLADSLR
jgi:predicted nucleic acid-binding protein